MAFFNVVKRESGFTLLEAMVSFAVVGIGLLAVVKLNTDLISTSSGSKSRAVAIALAKEKLEEYRNYTYTNAAAMEAGMVDGSEAATTIGNASFTRGWDVNMATPPYTVAVTVSWSDQLGTDSVTLSTALNYTSPATDIAQMPTSDPLIFHHGNAKIGGGLVADTDTSVTGNNGDGTSTIQDGDDIKLVIADGDEVADTALITLEDACQSDVCTNFVKIKGTFFIETSNNSHPSAAGAFVQASSITYCQQYYYRDSAGAIVTDPTVKSLPVLGSISTNMSNAPTTGSYQFFHYTCYLGAGWHGNIGVKIAEVKGGQTQAIDDKTNMCVGDPNSDEYYKQPQLSLRRTYRGMVYEKCADINNNNATDGCYSGKTLKVSGATDADQMVKYLSEGVAGGKIIGGVADNVIIDGQDFVLTYQTGTTTRSDCGIENPFLLGDTVTNADTSPGFMLKSGSDSGNHFISNPTQFLCLNVLNYLDIDQPDLYGAETDCRYNPVSPPAEREVINGTVTLNAIPQMPTATDILVGTSDNPHNCSLTGFSWDTDTNSASATYSCFVYHDEPDITTDDSGEAGYGWSGYIQLKASSNLGLLGQSCVDENSTALDYAEIATGNILRARRHFTKISTTQNGKNFTCTGSGSSSSSSSTSSSTSTSTSTSTTSSTSSSSSSSGVINVTVVVSGVWGSNSNNQKIASMTMSGTGGSPSGSCAYTTDATTRSPYTKHSGTFTCTSGAFASGTTWSGTILFTGGADSEWKVLNPPGSETCNGTTTATATLTNITGGSYAGNTILIDNNNVTCP
ncbi:MAG: prepilin-type N-terminal cleavage/methylation domain-containing protein [Gammaproteobacteria bacterium]|nr:prepilin-type N-terminal cleavage/methylation domain-containing protein [Gammaproteobacteria bacterium]